MIGVLAGIIGTIQATEALKLISGIGRPLTDRLLDFDARKTAISRNQNQAQSGLPALRRHPTITELFDDGEPSAEPVRPAATILTSGGVTMDKMKALVCRECGKEYPTKAIHVCEMCFGPLEVKYNYEEIKKTHFPQEDRGRPAQHVALSRPACRSKAPAFVGPHAGIDAAGAREESRRLSRHSTSSILRTIRSITRRCRSKIASSPWRSRGRANSDSKPWPAPQPAIWPTPWPPMRPQPGMRCYVFIPGDLEAAKVLGNLIYKPNVVEVEGNYDDVNRLCSEIAGEHGWAFVNINIRPYYAEGSKTLAFETVEQLGWRTPDQVVIPMASGSLLTKIWKGLHEMQALGLVDDVRTKINGAQAEGCSPISTAFKAGRDFFKPVKPKTIAKSLAIGNPADGYYALKATAESKGAMDMVTDEEVVEGIKLLAQTEGIFAETAGGVTIGVLKKLVKQGLDQERAT